jgi:hypothetical protein
MLLEKLKYLFKFDSLIYAIFYTIGYIDTSGNIVLQNDNMDTAYTFLNFVRLQLMIMLIGKKRTKIISIINSFFLLNKRSRNIFFKIFVRNIFRETLLYVCKLLLIFNQTNLHDWMSKANINKIIIE